ncbi:MAG: hypothetical protein CFE27_09990 [Alphaproteobacteria bacterium PA1]|nr:MAG: hypothetical protein CFE27_09990 [Alphaproteobacteria bacterium PA1]
MQYIKWIFALCATLPSIVSGAPFDLTKATSGYLYFNLAGADMARHDGELKNCISHWASGIRPEPAPYTAGIVGIIVIDSMNAHWEGARKDINIEHCMVAKGWQLVRLPDEEGERLAKLPRNELVQALSPYVSAEQPKGEIVRTWKNETIYQSTLIGKSPEPAKRTLLSALAISADNPEIPGITSIHEVTRKEAHEARKRQHIFGIKTNKLVEATALQPGQVRLIYSVRSSKKKRQILTFIERSDPSDPMGSNFFGVFGERDALPLPDGTFLSHRSVLVPAGLWFVQGPLVNLDNCLGAPSFEAKDGTTAYLGTFDTTTDKIGVSMDMTMINEALSQSGIGATPVQWQNGFTYPCRQTLMYALEFEGFPFLENYKWGSQGRKSR